MAKNGKGPAAGPQLEALQKEIKRLGDLLERSVRPLNVSTQPMIHITGVGQGGNGEDCPSILEVPMGMGAQASLTFTVTFRPVTASVQVNLLNVNQPSSDNPNLPADSSANNGQQPFTVTLTGGNNYLLQAVLFINSVQSGTHEVIIDTEE
jgi:hypothetical protein